MARKSLSRSRAALVGAVLLGVIALPAVAQAGRPLEGPAPGFKQGAAAGSAPLAMRAAHKAPPPMANLEECEQAPGGFCGTVDVPLDRKRPARGDVSLFFEYYPRRDGEPTDQAIFITEGGPGFSVTVRRLHQRLLPRAVRPAAGRARADHARPARRR